MSPDQQPYPGGFVPGDLVEVTDGTFAGTPGRVVSPEEAETLRDRFGGEMSVFRRPPGQVWVVLTLFDRPVPLLLEPFLLRRIGRA
jgi:transcription antitermination factor NusG